MDEGDYAECIEKTETLLRERFPGDQTLVDEAVDAMRKGYRAGRAMREENETAEATEGGNFRI